MKQKLWLNCGEEFRDIISARITAHDYAHDGWYTKVVRNGEEKQRSTRFEVWVCWGPRAHFPACCKLKPRWKVPEDKEKILWKAPENSRALRRRKES